MDGLVLIQIGHASDGTKVQRLVLHLRSLKAVLLVLIDVVAEYTSADTCPFALVAHGHANEWACSNLQHSNSLS